MNHSSPLAALRHHVTGAIERGEKQAIAGIPSDPQSKGQIFRDSLRNNVRAYIRDADLQGTSGMSVGNLMQCVKTPSEFLPGAPKGTNARYFYAEMFREICAEREFAFFVL